MRMCIAAGRSLWHLRTWQRCQASLAGPCLSGPAPQASLPPGSSSLAPGAGDRGGCGGPGRQRVAEPDLLRGGPLRLAPAVGPLVPLPPAQVRPQLSPRAQSIMSSRPQMPQQERQRLLHAAASPQQASGLAWPWSGGPHRAPCPACRYNYKLPRYNQMMNALTWMSHSQNLRRMAQEYVIDLCAP